MSGIIFPKFSNFINKCMFCNNNNTQDLLIYPLFNYQYDYWSTCKDCMKKKIPEENKLNYLKNILLPPKKNYRNILILKQTNIENSLIELKKNNRTYYIKLDEGTIRYSLSKSEIICRVSYGWKIKDIVLSELISVFPNYFKSNLNETNLIIDKSMYSREGIEYWVKEIERSYINSKNANDNIFQY